MINEGLQTLIVVTVAISSVFLLGYPLANFAVKHLGVSCSSEQLWAVAPLVGTGTIILVCQNLLYVDVRIPYSAILLWVGIGLVIVASIVKARFSFSDIPWKLIATGVTVYVVHGAGLLISGVSNYYGYGWGDMYNYVAQAQFFIDFPYSTTFDAHEYVYVANAYKHDRIGQSVLHAFIAASSGADAQQTFGATILLSPMLIFFSLFLLSTRLGIERRFAFPAAVIASLSPAIASVHLECFFSQAMATPFVFLWPLVVSRLRSHPGLRSSLVAGLLLAVTAAIYTEVLLPLILIAVIVLLVAHWHNGTNNASTTLPVGLRQPWRGSVGALLSFGLVLVVGVCANIGYFKSAIGVMLRTTSSGVLGVLYPWAFKPEGLARLWIGHQSPSPSGWLLYALVSASGLAVLTAVAYAGSLCKKNLEPEQEFSALVTCMPLAPLLLSMLTKNEYPYQFFKLLLIVWPLILFFAACGLAEWISRISRGPSFIYFQIALVSVCFALTNQIVSASIRPETTANSSRGGSHLLIDANFKQMRTAFDGMNGKQIYIWWYDKALWDGSWRGRWLAYFARNNIVWSMKPIDSSVPGAMFESLPINAIKVPAFGISWKEVPVGTKVKIGSSAAGTDPFWLYQLTNDTEVRRLDQVSREYSVAR